MAANPDRVGELLEGTRRKRTPLVSPEGLALDVQVAGRSERVAAFALDILFMFVAIIGLYLLLLLLLLTDVNARTGMTLLLFIAFIVRNGYFLHFEMAWQGRTPGKKICGLRVIRRDGGELAPAAVIARNLTREVEFFLPLSLFLSLGLTDSLWERLALLGWILGIAALPLFNSLRLRAGDLIAGTLVIAVPKRALLPDLTAPAQKTARRAYSFTHAQLAVYGAFELQMLEEFLRRPPSVATEYLLAESCRKICRKIGWPDAVPPQDLRLFLTDFYAAERAELERGQLFGQAKADKFSQK